MKQLALLNPENATNEEIKKYPTRETARAVVFNDNRQVALLHVTKQNYYKLPGGGKEDFEDVSETLQRECREEIGAEVSVLAEIGSIVEHRKFYSLTQVSYCYLAKIRGEQKLPEFTDEEKEEGFALVWLPYDKAVALLSRNVAEDIEGRDYIVPRDTIFLKAARQYINII